MVYTEIKKRDKKIYYYRVISVRNKDKISKKRIYLGSDLSKNELFKKEIIADKQLLAERINKRDKEIEKIKSKILKILRKNGVKKAGIFGSYATGEQKKKSDVDILVQPPKHMGLEFFGLQLELQDKLKKKVDLVTYKSIHPLLKERILNEEVRII